MLLRGASVDCNQPTGSRNFETARSMLGRPKRPRSAPPSSPPCPNWSRLAWLSRKSKSSCDKTHPFFAHFSLSCRAARGRCSFAGTGIVAAETGRSSTRRRLTASSGRAWWMMELGFARRPRSTSTTRFGASRPARRGGGARVLIWPVLAPGARPRPAGGRGWSWHGMRRLLACHLPMLSASPAELEFRASSMC